MSDSNTSNFLRQCAGPIPRRGFMQMGLAGFASLSLPGVMRMRAESPAQNKKERTAIIMVFLPGFRTSIHTIQTPMLAASIVDHFRQFPRKFRARTSLS